MAAILIEPIAGEGGFIVPGEGFLPGLAEYARKNGIVFIADEVQTGFARTGQMFACEDEGVVPDIITTAKGIAGGMPLAAVTGRADSMDAIQSAASVARTAATRWRVPPPSARSARSKSKTWSAKARADRRDHDSPSAGDAGQIPDHRDVRGRGAMLAVELVKPGTLEPATDEIAAVVKHCHSEGVLVLTAGTSATCCASCLRCPCRSAAGRGADRPRQGVRLGGLT